MRSDNKVEGEHGTCRVAGLGPPLACSGRVRDLPMKRERRASRRRVEEDEEERTVGEILRDLQTEVGLQGALLSIAPSTGLRVDVDAEEGMVYLRGEVASEEQKVEAERIVRSLLPRGVKGIRNELVVNPDISHLPHP